MNELLTAARAAVTAREAAERAAAAQHTDNERTRAAARLDAALDFWRPLLPPSLLEYVKWTMWTGVGSGYPLFFRLIHSGVDVQFQINQSRFVGQATVEWYPLVDRCVADRCVVAYDCLATTLLEIIGEIVADDTDANIEAAPVSCGAATLWVERTGDVGGWSNRFIAPIIVAAQMWRDAPTLDVAQAALNALDTAIERYQEEIQ